MTAARTAPANRAAAAGRCAAADAAIAPGAPRPAGWSGKLWAVSQGVARPATADFVLLTDADIVHEPRASVGARRAGRG